MQISDDLVAALEWSEAIAWSDSVEALASVPGNPAGAEVDRVGDVPIPIVAGHPDGFFNYVTVLGIDRPATEAEVAAVASAYASRSQTSWAVTVGPTRASRDLPDLLRLYGLKHELDLAKVVRSTKDVPAATCDLRVEKIGPERAAAFAAINLEAWEMPSTLEGWFSRCVGRPGWHHYAGFDGDVVVATGAIFVRGDIGWLSWAATAPSHRGRGAQSALISRRIRDAAELGCSIVTRRSTTSRSTIPAPRFGTFCALDFSSHTAARASKLRHSAAEPSVREHRPRTVRGYLPPHQPSRATAV